MGNAGIVTRGCRCACQSLLHEPPLHPHETASSVMDEDVRKHVAEAVLPPSCKSQRHSAPEKQFGQRGAGSFLGGPLSPRRANIAGAWRQRSNEAHLLAVVETDRLPIEYCSDCAFRTSFETAA